MFKRLIATTMVLVGTGCQPDVSEQTQADQMANSLQMQYELISNQAPNNDSSVCVELGAEWATCNQFDILLTANDNGVISTDWTIYFHSVRRLLDIQSDQVEIIHHTGDFYEMRPTTSFAGIDPGETLRIPIVGEFFEVGKSDFLPGAFVVVGDSEPRQIVAMDTEDLNAIVLDIPESELQRNSDEASLIETAALRYEQNMALGNMPAAASIFPTPVAANLSEVRVDVGSGFQFAQVEMSAGSFDALVVSADRQAIELNGEFPVIAVIRQSDFSGEAAVSGAYRLSITPDGVGVSGFDERGVFYGLNTLFGLVSDQQLPLGDVLDYPRFDYRGVMIDVARNFHSKDFILRLIDEMSFAKLNKLSLHLTDDEGWRLEIPGLPELTEVGAERCFDLTEQECLLPQLGSGATTDNFGSGYYSRQDFIDILRYAQARQVDVIPEIDMPAHARAAVVAMEARYNRLVAEGDVAGANEFRLIDPEDTSNVTTVQYYDRLSFINPCVASSTRFTEKLLFEVASMYRDAGVRLGHWHFAGDEAKNIMRGAGFQDSGSDELVDFKGAIDLSNEDYPFEQSPACKMLIDDGVINSAAELPTYWAEKVSEMSVAAGFPVFQAWEDGLKYADGAQDFASEQVYVNFWEMLAPGGSSTAYDWAAKGYDLVISVPDYLYFDFPQAIDQQEAGYYWATRANTLQKVFGFAPENLPQNASNSVNSHGHGFTADSDRSAQSFAGMSVQLWSELVRTDVQAEYMMYPRLYAAGERAWHRAGWELDYTPGTTFSLNDGLVDQLAIQTDYKQFLATLAERILPRLHVSGANYRLPLPGGVIVDGELKMNTEIPDYSLEYSVDNGVSWSAYHASETVIISADSVLARSVAEDRYSRAVVISAE
ncbi:MAG: family 20 glycosylhydrolase [Pseudomonadales bacterium]|jgi:hexosaminidase